MRGRGKCFIDAMNQTVNLVECSVVLAEASLVLREEVAAVKESDKAGEYQALEDFDDNRSQANRPIRFGLVARRGCR